MEKTTKKILIVDDDGAICKTLEKFLNKKGYQASSALSGEEAVEKIEKNSPHIVLLDIKMRGINGIETLKRIRKIDRNVHIIMITASGDDDTAKKCIELGACDHIIKPFDLEYLENLLAAKAQRPK